MTIIMNQSHQKHHYGLAFDQQTLTAHHQIAVSNFCRSGKLICKTHHCKTQKITGLNKTG